MMGRGVLNSLQSNLQNVSNNTGTENIPKEAIEEIIACLFCDNELEVNQMQKAAIIALLSQNIKHKIDCNFLGQLAKKFASFSARIDLQPKNEAIPAEPFAEFVENIFLKHFLQNKEEIETIDVCGTGGDGKNTLNISTTLSFLLAKSGLFNVIKHGNVGVSSVSGSADIFRLAGVDFSPERQAQNLRQNHLCFLFAPFYNTAFGKFADIRKALGVKTIFNLLGPMLNPARPNLQLIGTFSSDVEGYAKAAQIRGLENFAICHSFDGGDEISAIHPTKICIYKDGTINSFVIIPQDFGIETQFSETEILGKDPEYNFAKMQALLSGQTAGLECFLAFVLVNFAMCLYLQGADTNLKNCYQLANHFVRKITN